MKKLMIIGASILQLPAIKKGKQMGLHVAVVDYNPKAIGIPFADKYYNASTMDIDAVLEAAKDYNPDGIMTLATDMPVRSVCKVGECLGLVSNSFDTAIKATDKHQMILCFKEHNVPSPWFYVIHNESELNSLREFLTYPCIMKPTDNAGSHGVVLLNSFEELSKAYPFSVSNSRSGNVIIEEFLEGKEISVEIMVIDGDINILQITDKLTTGAPHFVEMGHSQPSCFNGQIRQHIEQVSKEAVNAIGILNGPVHVEMMITKNGPVMIELGARMGGDNITTHLVPLSTGIDMVQETIKISLGIKPNLTKLLDKGSAIRYITAPIGIIKQITGVSEAMKIKGIKQISILKEIGDKSTDITCSNDRLGFVIAQGDSAEEAISICESAIKLINIEVE